MIFVAALFYSFHYPFFLAQMNSKQGLILVLCSMILAAQVGEYSILH